MSKKKKVDAKQTSHAGTFPTLKPKRNKNSKKGLTESRRKTQKENKQKKEKKERTIKSKEISNTTIEAASTSQQLSFFLQEFQSANNVKLSFMELQEIKDECILDLPQDVYQNVDLIWKPVKDAFGQSWMEELAGKQLVKGKIEWGSPCVIVVCSSALKSVELLRGFRPFTKECPPAKIFSKHMKIDEQVSLLKNRVNIACGTPNRIKKLIEMEALSISRLRVLVMDMRRDAKCYSLLTLPQVRDDFWDMYKTYFHQKLVEGGMRICLYGPISVPSSPSQQHPST